MRFSGHCNLSRTEGTFGSAPASRSDRRAVKSRRTRSFAGIGETLEPRVVLSGSPTGMLVTPPGAFVSPLELPLNELGVVTGPVLAPTSTSSSSSSDPAAQVQAACQALQTELAILAAKSGVTAADVAGLVADDQAILGLNTGIDFGALDTAVSELATAIAGGTSTAQAQSDFDAAFAGGTASSDAVKQSFADLSKTIIDSGVTTTDLTAVAADWAAIGKAYSPDLPANFPHVTIINVRPIPDTGTYPVQGADTSLLAGVLTYNGAVTGPLDPGPVRIYIPSAQTTQFLTDLNALRTELSSLAAKSGVTIADLTSLAADSQAIESADSQIDRKGLSSAVNELATAIAGGTSTAQADRLRRGLHRDERVSGRGDAIVCRPEQGNHRLGRDDRRPDHRRRRPGRHREGYRRLLERRERPERLRFELGRNLRRRDGDHRRRWHHDHRRQRWHHDHRRGCDRHDASHGGIGQRR